MNSTDEKLQAISNNTGISVEEIKADISQLGLSEKLETQLVDSTSNVASHAAEVTLEGVTQALQIVATVSAKFALKATVAGAGLSILSAFIFPLIFEDDQTERLLKELEEDMKNHVAVEIAKFGAFERSVEYEQVLESLRDFERDKKYFDSIDEESDALLELFRKIFELKFYYGNDDHQSNMMLWSSMYNLTILFTLVTLQMEVLKTALQKEENLRAKQLDDELKQNVVDFCKTMHKHNKDTINQLVKDLGGKNIICYQKSKLVGSRGPLVDYELDFVDNRDPVSPVVLEKIKDRKNVMIAKEMEDFNDLKEKTLKKWRDADILKLRKDLLDNISKPFNSILMLNRYYADWTDNLSPFDSRHVLGRKLMKDIKKLKLKKFKKGSWGFNFGKKK